MAKFTHGAAWLLASALSVAVAGCGATDPRTALPAEPAATPVRQDAVSRGQVFVTTACAGCHAIGRDDASPLAEAPPLRDIAARRDPESLADGFADGLVTSHPAMPEFVFRASEIDDLMAWLETLNRPVSPRP